MVTLTVGLLYGFKSNNHKIIERANQKVGAQFD